MSKRIRLLTLALLLVVKAGNGQSGLDSLFAVPDTALTLTADEFYAVVLRFHPVAKQAGLLNEMALQEIRMARGSFDPKLNASFERKDYEGKTYYEKLDGYVSIPTWFPINPKVGVQRNDGDYLNPSDRIPTAQQLYAGVSIPLGRGLFTDERRTTLQQARLFQTMAQAEQIKIVNKLLLNAVKDYWTWYHTYYNYQLFLRATSIAEEIFRRTRMDYAFGQAAAIDTVQANIILQTRLVEKQEAWLHLQNATIAISNYLWDDTGDPLQLSPILAPITNPSMDDRLELQTLESLRDLALENHPDLLKLRMKINQLELDNRLAKEYLKPRLDLSYAALSGSTGTSFDPFGDYKFGLDFSIPVFLRKERSKLSLTKLKIAEAEYDLSQSQREIINQINVTFHQINNTNGIINSLEVMVDLYSKMLDAELLNLENGESDLFKINIQQEKLIQSQSKLVKAISEYQKSKASLYWAAGVKNINLISDSE